MFFIFSGEFFSIILGLALLFICFILAPVLTTIGLIMFIIVLWNIFKTPPPAT